MKPACLCRTYPGCRNQPASNERLCDICIDAHHRAYTERQVALATAKRKEHHA